MKKLRPLCDRVIVKRLNRECSTASGIVLLETVAENPAQGEILAVGPGKRDNVGKLIPMNVKVGQHVLFGKHINQTMKINGEELLVMREENLLAVFKG